MKKLHISICLMVLAGLILRAVDALSAEAPLKIPRFSTGYMDTSVDPRVDFYHYACGTWLKTNPIPEDKPRWSAFIELSERNWHLIRELLENAAQDSAAPAKSPKGEVGAFFASAMDTNRLEQLRFKPVEEDFARIDALHSTDEMMRLIAEFQSRDVNAMFNTEVSADARNSAIYAFQIGQGGLGLPDRDYYLGDRFAKQREAYQAHIAKMFLMNGAPEAQAKTDAAKTFALETELAKASKARADLRDPVANYHKFTTSEAEEKFPNLAFKTFFDASGIPQLPYLVIGQPEFLSALDKLVKERPLDDWKAYLRWHALHNAAPFLHAAAEEEYFNFYGKTLRGTPVQEPRWQRAAHVIDACIGEALGQLYVEKNFPPAARARMIELIGNLKTVLRERIEKVDWMGETTRAKALAKFDKFTQKIGYPDKFRDYSKVEFRRDDYIGNVRRAQLFESKRELARVGKPVDRSEWGMTPSTVNAYYSPEQNEIVFPAGILQPPFFDPTMDDAVNYGAIGVVIGHEMTHGYDDQGRKFDGDGNLNNWWTDADAEAFQARSQKLVDQFNGYEPLPGVKVNGHLTLGENIADLGGMKIAYTALEHALDKDPAKRKMIDGFTPEQRFFLSFSQIWRTNIREAEARRLVTVDPHSPGQFRAIGPEVNLQEFFHAFGIKEGDPMWRAQEKRALIW